MNQNKEILISVIIPTYNEEKYIKECLDCIKKNLNCHEIIIVDANSEDKTIETAKKYTDKIILTDKKNIAFSRNKGAEISTGNILFFIDADVLISKDFIERSIRIFKSDKNIGAISSVFKPIDKDNNYINRFIVKYLINGYTKFSLFIKKPHITGGAFSIRREIFIRIGGFNNNLIVAEDVDIFRRAKSISKIIVSNDLISKISMRRFQDLRWIYSWILGSFYFEITGKSLVKNYKAKR